jgi:hypothetical protein
LTATILAACGSGAANSTGVGTKLFSTSSPVTSSSLVTSPSPVTSPSSIAVPSQVSVTSLEQFQMTNGRPVWESQNEALAIHSVLYLHDDGTFSYTTANQVGVPLAGRYQVSGPTVTFSGYDYTPEAAGENSLAIWGTVDLGRQIMELSYADAQGMQAYVDGEGFGSSDEAAWTATVAISSSYS